MDLSNITKLNEENFIKEFKNNRYEYFVEYDKDFNALRMQDEFGHTVEMDYDDQGRIIKYAGIKFDGTEIDMTYEYTDNSICEIDIINGTKTSYDYEMKVIGKENIKEE